MEKVKEFVLDSEGQCFFCPSSPNIVSEHETESACPSFTSIHCLTHYLGMDLRKVLNEKGALPFRLKTKAGRPQLTVELCADCAATFDKFSKLYEQFEKIELEMRFYLKQIQEKLAFAEDYQMTELKGNRQIVEVLRSESLEKCTGKLRMSKPIVKVQNLTMAQLAVKEKKRRLEQQNPILSPDDASSTSQQNRESDDYNLHQTTSEGEANANDRVNDNVDPEIINCEERSQQFDSMTTEDQLGVVGRTELNTGKSSAINITPSNISSSKIKSQRIFDPTTGKHKCGICSKEFGSKYAVLIHHNSIHLKLRYKCRLCHKDFSQRVSYNRHHRSVHMGVKFKCKICKKLLTQKSYLLRHQLAYHEKLKKGSRNAYMSTTTANVENQTMPQLTAESVTPRNNGSREKRKELEAGIASARPVKDMSSNRQFEICDNELETHNLDSDQAPLNEEDECGNDFDRGSTEPVQIIVDVDPDMTSTVQRPPSEGNIVSEIPTQTTEVVMLKAKEESKSRGDKRTRINKNSFRSIIDKRLRRKMLNKAAAARYRQKMKEKQAATLAGKEKPGGLPKRKEKLGTKFNNRANEEQSSKDEVRKGKKSPIRTGNVEGFRSKLRIIHRCSKCIRTFPTAVRLEEHRKSEGCGCFKDKQV